MMASMMMPNPMMAMMMGGVGGAAGADMWGPCAMDGRAVTLLVLRPQHGSSTAFYNELTFELSDMTAWAAKQTRRLRALKQG